MIALQGQTSSCPRFSLPRTPLPAPSQFGSVWAGFHPIFPEAVGLSRTEVLVATVRNGAVGSPHQLKVAEMMLEHL